MNRSSALFLNLALPVVSAMTAFLAPCASALESKMPLGKIGANNVVKLEVAQTEKEIERGLMYRTSLPEDQGMVFIFSPPRPVSFWMAHCFISLDMVFIKNGKVIRICENVPPCRAKDERECPTYPPDAMIEVSEVVELAAGYCKRHDVKVGDPVSFEMTK